MTTTLAFIHGADWIWILLIVLILFGGTKLPALARGLGRSVSEFKRGREESEKEAHHEPTVVDTSRPDVHSDEEKKP